MAILKWLRLEPMTRSQQRALSWQSLALDSQGHEFDSHRRPWSFSQMLSQIFVSVEFTIYPDTVSTRGLIITYALTRPSFY